MKNLKDLKDDILNKKFSNFYIFYGDDYGLRHHYIKEIAKQFNNKINVLYDMQGFTSVQTGGKLFRVKKLYIVFGDYEFAKSKKTDISEFLRKLKDETFILCYDEELPSSTLFKEFSDYITYFPCVKDNIAYQFVDSEICLSQKSKEELAFNCNNNYNNILLESNKIRNYAQAKGLNEQNAYEELEIQNQLLYRFDEFHSDAFMNDVLKNNRSNFGIWYSIIKNNFLEEFWIAMENIMNNYIIAYLLVKKGRYNGSNDAYNYRITLGKNKNFKRIYYSI